MTYGNNVFQRYLQINLNFGTLYIIDGPFIISKMISFEEGYILIQLNYRRFFCQNSYSIKINRKIGNITQKYDLPFHYTCKKKIAISTL